MKWVDKQVAFKAEGCCKKTISFSEQLAVDYYSTVRSQLDTLIEKAYQNQIFGKDTEAIFNAINDYHYLFTYLLMIADEMRRDAEYAEYVLGECPNDSGIDYYTEKYNINCIIKHFNCQGYDIKNVLQAFGLYGDSNDGINYMHISYNRQDCTSNRNIFRSF